MRGKLVNKLVRTLLYVFISFYAIVSLYPMVWMIFNSFKNNREIFETNVFGIPKVLRLENYIKAVHSFNILRFFENSIIVAVCTVTVTLFLSLMFSYATARMKWKLATVSRIYVTAGMFIPVQIIMIPLVILARNLHISNSLLSLIIPYAAFELPFSSIVLYGFYRTIPNEIEEAATIDGANIYRVFFSIIMPLVKSAIASVLIFVFLFSWNEFYMALIIISNNNLMTLPLGLINFQGQFQTDWGAMAATMTIASLPTVIVYLFFSEQVEKALTVGSAVKG
jgi:raffinose/stachyose/melibiose transport system permease protein